jgi:hypothetical protein
MSETPEAQADPRPTYETVTHDGLTSSSNVATEDEMRENLEAEPKPRDGEPKDPEQEEQEKASKAASELGKRGAAARAEKEKTEAEEKPDEKADEKGEAQAAEETEAEKEDKRKKVSREEAKARVLEKTREAAELRRALAAERAEKEELKRRLTPQAEKAGDDKAPNWDEYEDASKYMEDLTSYRVRQERKAWEAEQAQARQEQQKQHYEHARQQRVAEIETGFAGQIDAARESNPEFNETTVELAQVLVPSYRLEPGERPGPLNVITDEMMQSERGAELLLHLSQHPDEFKRLAELRTPRDITREMAILERSLAAAPKPLPAEPSKAKPPIRPVAGTAHPGDPNELSDTLPFDEWVTRRRGQERAKRR